MIFSLKAGNGNLKAISKLCEGMPAPDLVKNLRGLECGSKKTSCGDQLARAVEKALEHQSKQDA